MQKLLYDYASPKSEPHVIRVSRINPYLVEAANAWVTRRSQPLLQSTPAMRYGSMPIDDGWLILDSEAYGQLVAEEPAALEFIRPYTGSEEFINGTKRYCLWLVDCPPHKLRQLPLVTARVKANRAYRLTSDRQATRKLAQTPALFGEIRQPKGSYLLVPKVLIDCASIYTHRVLSGEFDS